jgi:hypothetical protein
VACAAAIAVSVLVSYQYYNGTKLLSSGHLTVAIFTQRTMFMKKMCGQGFVLAAMSQLLALIIIRKTAKKLRSLVQGL